MGSRWRRLSLEWWSVLSYPRRCAQWRCTIPSSAGRTLGHEVSSVALLARLDVVVVHLFGLLVDGDQPLPALQAIVPFVRPVAAWIQLCTGTMRHKGWRLHRHTVLVGLRHGSRGPPGNQELPGQNVQSLKADTQVETCLVLLCLRSFARIRKLGCSNLLRSWLTLKVLPGLDLHTLVLCGRRLQSCRTT